MDLLASAISKLSPTRMMVRVAWDFAMRSTKKKYKQVARRRPHLFLPRQKGKKNANMAIFQGVGMGWETESAGGGEGRPRASLWYFLFSFLLPCPFLDFCRKINITSKKTLSPRLIAYVMRPFFLRGVSFVRSWSGRTVKVCVCVWCLVSGGGLVSLDLGFLQSLVRPIWSIVPSCRVEFRGI